MRIGARPQRKHEMPTPAATQPSKQRSSGATTSRPRTRRVSKVATTRHEPHRKKQARPQIDTPPTESHYGRNRKQRAARDERTHHTQPHRRTTSKTGREDYETSNDTNDGANTADDNTRGQARWDDDGQRQPTTSRNHDDTRRRSVDPRRHPTTRASKQRG